MVNQSGKMNEPGGDFPGNEIPKDYRDIATELVRNQGWRYQKGSSHPKLFPADKTKGAIILPTTPSDNRKGRGLQNFVHQVRRSGGLWPPRKEK